jgi:hypothetical protein
VAFAGNKFGEGMLGPCTIDHVNGMLALFLSCLEIANQNHDFRSSSSICSRSISASFGAQLLKLGVEGLPVGADAGVAEATVLRVSFRHVLREA